MHFLLWMLIGAWLALPVFSHASEAPWPEARWGHVFIYFPPSDRYVLFGGASQRGSYRDDMWTWDGQAWEAISVETPTSRGFAAAAYDPTRKAIILHGGRGDDRVTHNDLWSWDGSAWILLDADSPFTSDHHEMAYSPGDRGMLLFGGWTGSGVSGETWIWNGVWNQPGGAGPPPRSAFGMALNEKRGRVELYGGLWINGQYADAWARANGRWIALGGPYDNSSLDHLAMFYDALSGGTLVFGGKDYRYTMRGETRRLSESGAVEILEASGPSPRHSVRVAFDSGRNRAALFGGKVYQEDKQLPLDDLWIWENGGWHPISMPVEKE